MAEILAQVFKIMIGRIPLFLIDTNVRENSPEKRNITSRLYAADSKIRLAQEDYAGHRRHAGSGSHGHPSRGLSFK